LLIGVRFTDAPVNVIESLRSPQTATSMIYLGYLSINSVIEQILPVERYNHVNQSDRFASTKKHLTQIFPLRFRLELLENIFSLIFIQKTELKVDESMDIVERSSNTPSISLSNSDKFISSLQSNRSYDGPPISGNASIQTQISARQSNNEFIDDPDDDNDDNVSVYSSSMSSAGASNPHTSYRNGYLIDQDVLYQLLIFLHDQIAEVRSLSQKIKDKATDRDTVDLENSLDKCFHVYSIPSKEHFTSRATKLSTMISEALWRYQLLTMTTSDVSTNEHHIDGQDVDDTFVSNSTIKMLIIPNRKCSIRI
jgi:hypothetical protein